MADLTLPFEVAPSLKAFEAYIVIEARKLASSSDPVAFERAARAVMDALHRRISGYQALGRLATDKESLAARLAR